MDRIKAKYRKPKRRIFLRICNYEIEFKAKYNKYKFKKGMGGRYDPRLQYLCIATNTSRAVMNFIKNALRKDGYRNVRLKRHK